jgi:capsular polysaccharide biosynthesis protein
MTSDDRIDARPYTAIFTSALARHWPLVLLVFVVTVAVAAALLFFVVTPTYQARAELLLTRARPVAEFDLDERYRAVALTDAEWQARRRSLAALAQGNVVAAQVIADNGVALTPEQRNPDRLRQSVKFDDRGEQLGIVVEDPSPTRAADLANAWGTALERTFENLYGTDSRLGEDVRAKLVEARARLEEAEATRARFAATGRSPALNEALKYQQGRYTEAFRIQQRAERLLNDIGVLRDQLRGEDGPAASTQAALGELLLRLQAMTLESGGAESGFQVTIEPSTVQASPPSELVANLDRLQAVLEARRREAQAVIDSPTIQAEIEGLRQQIEAEAARDRQLVTARDVASDAYQLFTRKVTELDLNGQPLGDRLTLAAPAVPPDRPIRPNRWQSLVVAGLLGLVLGVGVAVGMELLGTRRRDARQQGAQGATAADARGVI